MKRVTSSPGKHAKTIKKKKTGDYQKGRELAKTPKQELKAFDTAFLGNNFHTIAGVPAFQLLNPVVNGAELYQRVGRKLYMKSLHIRGNIVQTATSTQDIGRILVVYDSQCNAAAPAIAALLQDSNAGAATNALSEINLTNRARFKILRDKQIIFPSATLAGGVQTNQAFQEQYEHSFSVNEFIKLGGLEAEYNGVNAGNIGDITSGAIFLVCVMETNDAVWQFQYTARLRYYD